MSDEFPLLTFEEINDALDQYSSWLTYDNVVGMDIEESVDPETGARTLQMLVETLTEEAKEEFLQRKASRGESVNLLDVPAFVEIPMFSAESSAETSEESSTESTEAVAQRIPVRQVNVSEIVEDALLLNLGEAQADVEGIALADEIEQAQVKVRPCPGGYLIRTHGSSGVGSLGVSISYRGKYRILSNNHVLAKNGNVGKWVYQPTAQTTANRLAKLSGFIRIQYYASSNPANPDYNVKDVAWCDSTTAISSQSVRVIGKVKGRRAPVKGETIKVFGGMSEQSRSAKIVSVTYRYRSHGALGYSFWQNGIKLDAVVTVSGDSGSAYVAASDSKLVGLHRSGNNSHSTGCPI